MTRRGDATRERILDAAELLYGARGVAGVSMREVRLAAGQRNSSAVALHFGDADGLLLALARRHMPRVGAIQERIHGELGLGDGPADPALLVEVLVRPWAEYLGDGPGARAWVRIAAELTARPERRWRDFHEHAPVLMLHVALDLLEVLEPTLGPGLARERLLEVSLAALHLCADRAAHADAPGPASRPALDHAAWTDDLADLAAGALFAPSRARR